MRVLDLACGAGSQILRTADRVGPEGRVVASDILTAMLSHVREAAEREGLSNIETLKCAAEELPGTTGVFDAAISRLGLMLFPQPKQALAAVQRVLKPKARIAALVFTTHGRNPFMAMPMQILLRHAGKEAPAAGRPGSLALVSGRSKFCSRTAGLPMSKSGSLCGGVAAGFGGRSGRDDAAGLRRHRATVADLAGSARRRL